jgi:hypothetical protein
MRLSGIDRRDTLAETRENMRILRFAAALLICLLCNAFASAQQPLDRAFVVDALKLALSVDKQQGSSGDPIVIQYTYTNSSKQELSLPDEPLVWNVQREDGNQVLDSPEGQKRKEARAHRSPQTLSVSPAIGPGANLSYKEVISNLFVMNDPGAYLISVRVAISDGKGTDFIKSNTIRIEVR